MRFKRLALLLFLIAAVFYSAPAEEPASEPDSLSPSAWKEEERARFAMLDRAWASPKLPAEGRSLMIAGTSSSTGVRAGLEALRRGGSAADAVIVTALAQIAHDAGCWNSFAGILSLVYYDASTGKVCALDAGYDAPRAETDPLSIPKRPIPSGRTALVPGFMAGIESAHKRFGRLPFKRLFEPAIEIAEKGFEIDTVLASLMASKKQVLTRLPAARSIFTKKDGTLYGAGDLFRQPELARTLRKTAEQGAAYMYSGEWARAFVRTVRAEGGTITLEDLKAYSPTNPDPLRTTYKGCEVFAPGLPSLGGLHLIEGLNLLELADPARHGHYTESAEALYRLIQASRMSVLISYSPRTYLLALFPETDFTPSSRATKKNAKVIWEKLKEPGWIQRFQGLLVPAGSHSDGIVAVDAEGNAAALTHSINTTTWGGTGIFVGGVSIPDSGSFQQDRLKKSGPGGRIPNGMNPVIILREGEPFAAFSCVGGGLHETMLSSLHNVLDFGWNPKKAAEAPVILSPLWTSGRDGKSQYHKQVIGKGEFCEEVLEGVRKRGQPLAVLSYTDHLRHRGYWVGLIVDTEPGLMKGGAPPHFNGCALGE